MARGTGQYALTFLLMFAIGIGVPISPLLASNMGASWIEIGLMGSACALIFTFSALMTGRVSDRIGRRPILAVSSVLSASAALLFMKATSISELIAIRGLDGLAWACFWPPMEALATETSDTGQIGRGIGLVTSVYALGFAIGSFAGGFITTVFGFALTFFTYFVFAALSILAVWLIAVPRHSWPSEPLLGDRLLPRLSSRDLIAGNVLGASYTFGLATIMALLSVYAAGIEIPVYWIGIAFSIFWVGRIIGAAFSGTASDRLGRRRVVMSALIAGSVGFVLIGIAPGFLLLATGAFLAGLSIGGVFPVNVAIIADDVAPARRGTAMGLYETVCAIAFMAASVLGGTSANLLTPRMPYMLSAVVFVSCAAALAILLPYRPRQSTRFERNVAD